MWKTTNWPISPRWLLEPSRSSSLGNANISVRAPVAGMPKEAHVVEHPPPSEHERRPTRSLRASLQICRPLCNPGDPKLLLLPLHRLGPLDYLVWQAGNRGLGNFLHRSSRARLKPRARPRFGRSAQLCSSRASARIEPQIGRTTSGLDLRSCLSFRFPSPPARLRVGALSAL